MSEHILNEKTLAFARKLVELAKEEGCANFTATFRPQSSMRGAEVKLSWSRGRHNAAANCVVESSIFEWIEI